MTKQEKIELAKREVEQAGIAAVLYEFEQCCHRHRVDALTEGQITRALLKEKANAQAAIEAIVMGCLPEKMDEGLAARHLAEEFTKAAKHGKRDIDKLQPYQDADRNASKTVGFNEAIDQTREAMKEKLREDS